MPAASRTTSSVGDVRGEHDRAGRHEEQLVAVAGVRLPAAGLSQLAAGEGGADRGRQRLDHEDGQRRGPASQRADDVEDDQDDGRGQGPGQHGDSRVHGRVAPRHAAVERAERPGEAEREHGGGDDEQREMPALDGDGQAPQLHRHEQRHREQQRSCGCAPETGGDRRHLLALPTDRRGTPGGRGCDQRSAR
jgi:hypothetical protein